MGCRERCISWFWSTIFSIRARFNIDKPQTVISCATTFPRDSHIASDISLLASSLPLLFVPFLDNNRFFSCDFFCVLFHFFHFLSFPQIHFFHCGLSAFQLVHIRVWNSGDIPLVGFAAVFQSPTSRAPMHLEAAKKALWFPIHPTIHISRPDDPGCQQLVKSPRALMKILCTLIV